MELSEIADILKEYREYYNVYRRLLVIHMVANGESIAKASKNINISRKTGERWVKQYNENGIAGLFSNYSNCGRKSYLTDQQLNELKEIITGNEEKYNLKDVRNLIKEKYGITYSEKQIWVITRQKLNLNYGKPFIKYNTRPENPEEDLKKN
ncbi:helix-turn-helix domain-containing protein [Methanobrevibacter oralis]|uniref:helix-turn-helix domain-containing protein n=1 Tax=Methanobrevibacter oralis TaxID=66851 RepID=UPI001E5897C5|nr:helix-turn-helix domain-containing protein [Methanobrevibacter oralis]